MLVASAFSTAAWICILLSVLGLSTTPSVVQTFAWAKGRAENPYFTATIHVGLRNRVVQLEPAPNVSLPRDVPSTITTSWQDEESCSIYSMNETCQACQDAVGATSTWAITSLLTQTVQVATDLQRTTPFGDVNCQKVMGVVTGLYGLISGLMALADFANHCWRTQPRTFSISTYPEVGTIESSFEAGPGTILIAIATVLKIVDVICHALVPTPTPRHAKPPSSIGPLPEYLVLGELDAPTRLGYPLNEAGSLGEYRGDPGSL